MILRNIETRHNSVKDDLLDKHSFLQILRARLISTQASSYSQPLRGLLREQREWNKVWVDVEYLY